MIEKILIAYFSRSGNTEHIAKIIHQEIGGELHRIIPETSYPEAYNTTVDQAKHEIQSGFQPPLRNPLASVSDYSLIFVGTPNWWRTMAPPVHGFLASHELAGKPLAPFCTHGGGGLGHIAKDIATLCPEATHLPPFTVYGSGGGGIEDDVSAWLEEIKKSL